jgi:hypothetical protein
MERHPVERMEKMCSGSAISSNIQWEEGLDSLQREQPLSGWATGASVCLVDPFGGNEAAAIGDLHTYMYYSLPSWLVLGRFD